MGATICCSLGPRLRVVLQPHREESLCQVGGACSPSPGRTGNRNRRTAAPLSNTSLCLPGTPGGGPALSPAALSASFTSSEGQRGLRRISCPAGRPAVPAAAAARRPCQGGRPVPSRSLRAERGPGRTPSVFICKADPVPAPSGFDYGQEKLVFCPSAFLACIDRDLWSVFSRSLELGERNYLTCLIIMK